MGDKHGLLRPRQRQSQTCTKTRPGQVYTGGKIDVHRSAIQRDRGAGRRQLPFDRGCARGHGSGSPTVAHSQNTTATPPAAGPRGQQGQAMCHKASQRYIHGAWVALGRVLAGTRLSPAQPPPAGWRDGLNPALSCSICFIICPGQQITQLWAF